MIFFAVCFFIAQKHIGKCFIVSFCMHLYILMDTVEFNKSNLHLKKKNKNITLPKANVSDLLWQSGRDVSKCVGVVALQEPHLLPNGTVFSKASSYIRLVMQYLNLFCAAHFHFFSYTSWCSLILSITLPTDII